MGGKQNVIMKPALVKNFFNMTTAEQDSVTVTKGKVFALLSSTKRVFYILSRCTVLFCTPFEGLGMKEEDRTNA